ncbi:peroxidase 5 [Physcomitrium patens]|uniref:Peroxidase n=1 Tax=Physcomitrium patens TaxID=3218 RepID=A0A2K1KVS5_PHYPA|nr:peroxidase 5-like [Physcomitrium patens]PNR57897.1 hypothetical protein PHYPA_004891 [Physcomitrium patens]|eukprot:XP_024370069.1 peroxidase 5-like [Physcomitrella patens]
MEMRLHSKKRKPALWTVMAMMIAQLIFHPRMCTGGALRPGYYAQTCPNAENIIRAAMEWGMQQDSGTAPGVLRLHFHDCFVDGCDGSVLLEGPTSEKTAPPNSSLRGFEVIDAAKAELEATCPGVVSCADILAYCARDAVIMTGGLGWPVEAGRLDGRSSDASRANAEIPDPSFNVAQLIDSFARKGLTRSDMIVLSGAHTIGRANCKSVATRLYPVQDPRLSEPLAAELKSGCPQQGGSATFNLDSTPDRFDNNYYANVVNGRGIMNSDQVLFDDPSTRPETTFNAVGSAPWAFRFSQIMLKMGTIDVKTGPQGEIRRNCRSVN